MTSQLYREFLNLFKRWPIDATKKGNDLGEYLRKKFVNSFTKGESSENIDLNYWTNALAELKRIANNEFVDKYPRNKGTAALGVGKEQCRVVLSNDAKKYFES